MNFSDIAKFRNYIILVLLAVFTAFAFWTRMLPADGLFAAGASDLLGNDPWYMLREIEAILANGLQYPWFDPMTYYPYGTDNFWGPLFPTIASILCIIAGASTQTDIMYVSSCLPPLMGAAMVPLMYGVGCKLEGWKTGILAALFTAVVSGQYMYRSLFGFVDHHIGEVFFGALFAFVYIYYLAYVREKPVDFNDKESLKIPALIAACAGIAYVLGYANMPTMILFGLITAGYTGLQFIWDRYKKQSVDYLVLLNVITFAVAILGVFAIGIHHEGMGMARYSLGHVVAYGAVIAVVLLLYGINRVLKEKSFGQYIGAIVGLAVVGFVFIFFALPEFVSFFISSLDSFFGYAAHLTTIQEAKHWDIDGAWGAFNFGLILGIAGFIISVWKFIKESKSAYLFVAIWSIVTIYSTTLQIRYEYYCAVNIALLSAVCLAWAAESGLKEVLKLACKHPEEAEPSEAAPSKGKKNAKPKTQKKQSVDYLAVGIFAAVLIASAIFAYWSVEYDTALGEYQKYGGMTSDWREALVWMGENTPDTGINYYEIYDRDSYENPQSAYGVMSWWDYGHWITFIAHRAPNANPFQEGVGSKDTNGASAFFINTDEEASNKILDALGTRFVITDAEMDTSKFWAMTTWYDETKTSSPYMVNVAQVDGNGNAEAIQLYNENYYNTMVSKLHNFDGSYTVPKAPWYVELVDGSLYRISLPIIGNAQQMSYADAVAKADAYNANPKSGTAAAVLGTNLLDPSGEVKALKHYRLVHESSTNVLNDGEDLKYVKTFEYVPGAHIKGEGIIEIDLMTNQGRAFTYRQQSENGEFVVPYSTTGDNYATKVLGNYRIAGTSQTFAVSEDAVMNGLYVN